MTDPNATADAIAPIKCEHCKGGGKIMRYAYSTEEPRLSTCPTCHGHGKVVPSLTLEEAQAAADLLRAQSKTLSAIETYLASWGTGNAPEAQTILDVIGGMVREVEEKKP
jgi:hypothetical protein